MIDTNNLNPGQKVLLAVMQEKRQKAQSISSDLDFETQQMLNKPQEIQSESIDQQDSKFLSTLIELIDSKKIDLYKPSSLLNHSVYDLLNPDQQAKAEQDSFVLLSKIREIHKLWNQNHQQSYQILYLVSSIRQTKERIEAASGDLYII